ncbi:MAG: hypothetical protein RIF39_00835, partial [Cyclobacteriaceae bacterium]
MRLYTILLFVITLGSCQSPNENVQPFVHAINSGPTPWSYEPTGKTDGQFTFAIISDLNGGEREGIFEVAIEQINLLQPEFILSVGDL